MMKVYQITGQTDHGEPYISNKVYSTFELAAAKIKSEIEAYEVYDGVRRWNCPYDFEIEELEVV